MRLSTMMLSESLAGAGGVEVAEGHELQPVQFMIPMKHPLEHELALAVRINRALGQIFSHRHAIWWAIGGAGGTEDKLFDFLGNRGFQKFESVGDVVAEILAGIGHRFSDESAGGEMEDGFGPGLSECVDDVIFLLRLAEDELSALVDGGTMAVGQS